MSILEVLMIVCFGLAWPINLYNSWKSKSTKGKNLLFMSFIVLAYVFGILNKLLVSVATIQWCTDKKIRSSKYF